MLAEVPISGLSMTNKVAENNFIDKESRTPEGYFECNVVCVWKRKEAPTREWVESH